MITPAKQSVLIVEDDVELCNSVITILHKSGFSTQGSTDIRDATLRMQNQKYSCLIFDMHIGSDSGTELVEYARSNPKFPNYETPILVISGFLDKDLVATLAGKIQGALVKPFDLKSLIELIKKVAKT